MNVLTIHACMHLHLNIRNSFTSSHLSEEEISHKIAAKVANVDGTCGNIK